MNILLLVEKKKEFTVRIINILSPLIFEGLDSIYDKAKEISCGDNVLKIFQSFLKRIPKWDDNILLNEANRIKTNCKDYDLLYDLIRACIKSNLCILAYSPSKNPNNKINPDYYKSINFNKFIHNIYIECARDVWNNPYLFYHNYTPIEIKRNQRDTIELIKSCIEESIRKSLPLKHVLEIYLGDDMVHQVPDDNFEKTITEVDEMNLKQLLHKDLYEEKNTLNQNNINSNFIARNQIISENNQLPQLENKVIEDNNTNNVVSSNSKHSKNNTKSSSTSSIRNSRSGSTIKTLSQKGGKESTSTKELNSKILNILNNGDIKLSEDINTSDNKIKELKKNSDDNITSDRKIEKNKKLSETSSEDLISTNMDSKLQKLLKNDLGETETESSANFKPEKNKQGYQEIFSNSNNDSTNTQQKNNEVNKNKFFNNYLQF